MALAVDSSSPAFKSGGVASSKITSNTFSPPAGSLLCVVAGGAGSSSSSAPTITDSLGTHLTWVKLAGALNGGGSTSSETLWVADCSSAQTNMTVSVTFNSGTVSASDGTIGILVFSGAQAAASQTGGTGTQAASALPSIVVTATAAGSMVVAGWWNWTNNTAPTVPSGQTTTFNGNVYTYSDTTGSYSWVQTHTALTTGAGSVTTNDTAPNVQLSGVAVEILAASGGAGAVVSVGLPQLMSMGVGS